VLSGLNLRCDEKYSGLSILEPIGFGVSHESDNLAYRGSFSRPYFGCLHPFVLSKSGMHNYVLVINHTGCRNIERNGQLEHESGLPICQPSTTGSVEAGPESEGRCLGVAI
jgi:hypothetical protein